MTQTAIKYAKVLWELQIPEEIIDASLEVYQSEPKLQQVLSDPTIRKDQKQAVIARIFDPAIVNFLKVMCSAGDMSYLQETVEAYKVVKNQANHTILAVLRYVTKPNETQVEGMKEFVRKHFGVTDVEMELVEEPALLGGFVLNAEGQEWDWSMKQRIHQMKQKLVGGDAR